MLETRSPTRTSSEIIFAEEISCHLSSLGSNVSDALMAYPVDVNFSG